MNLDSLVLGRLHSSAPRPTVRDEAPNLDFDYFRRAELYHCIPAQEVRAVGHQALGARCVDIKTTDGTHRSRLVAIEIEAYTAVGLLLPTQPIESLKYMLRQAAQDSSMSIMHIDVKRAYLYTEASRDMYIKYPMEEPLGREGDMCGKPALREQRRV